jgi:hypothetical protein
VVQVSFVSRVLVLGFTVLVIGSRSVYAQEPTHRVLLLYPYDDVSPATLTAGTAIRKRLAEDRSKAISNLKQRRSRG